MSDTPPLFEGFGVPKERNVRAPKPEPVEVRIGKTWTLLANHRTIPKAHILRMDENKGKPIELPHNGRWALCGYASYVVAGNEGYLAPRCDSCSKISGILR